MKRNIRGAMSMLVVLWTCQRLTLSLPTLRATTQMLYSLTTQTSVVLPMRSESDNTVLSVTIQTHKVTGFVQQYHSSSLNSSLCESLIRKIV